MSSIVPVYLMTIIVAGCSILYELILAQTITFFAANSVVWYSVTIGLYLVAMGVGAFSFQKVEKGTDLWSSLFYIECFLSLLGALSYVAICVGHMGSIFLWKQDLSSLGMGLLFGFYFLMVFGIGVLSGMELPLLLAMGKKTASEKSHANRILACDFLGSLLGAGMFPLLLLPHFDLLGISAGVGALNLLVAIIILMRQKRSDRSLSKIITAGVIFAIVVALFVRMDDLKQYFLKKYYLNDLFSDSLSQLFSSAGQLPDIETRRSVYQTMDIVKIPIPQDSLTIPLIKTYSRKVRAPQDFEHSYRLFINGDYQWSTNYEEIHHEYLAHIPIILNNKTPENILIIGGGDALLLRELLKYPQIKKITLVDIDPVIIDMARQHPVFKKLNHDALSDNRVSVIVDDGYYFLRHDKGTYDAIYLDVPIPNDYNLSKLYSREFFAFVNRRLADNGFAVFQAPESGIFTYHDPDGNQAMDPENNWEIYYHTLRAAGFGTVIPYVSNLELDNGLAIKSLFKIFGSYRTDEQGEIIIEPGINASKVKETIIQYVLSLQEGFIMVKKNPQQFYMKYNDPQVPMDILNETRFRLAFSLPYNFPVTIDRAKVNSIMKPTLPRSSLWWIKQP